jgi:hypothetical protein
MYIGSTVPFESAYKLKIHFVKHGWKFGAATQEDYERMADAFMSKPITADIYECVSPHGRHDRNRLEGSTLHFGAAYNGTVLYTFHPKTADNVQRKGGPLGFVLSKCAEVRF